jgi:HSP90 family molecular chaperone
MEEGMSWTTIEDKIQIADIGGRLLPNLAKGIYSADTVLREYVQNAADAFIALSDPPDSPIISITTDHASKSITIFDKGIGMDQKGVHDAKKIAVSPKGTSGDFIGFRGIGIWAGFQACAKLELETKKAGESTRYRLEVDFADILAKSNKNISIKDLLDHRFRIASQRADVDKNQHYTSVTLKGLHDDYMRLADEAEVRRIVSQTLPCQFDPEWQPNRKIAQRLAQIEGYREFQIEVNKNPVYKEFPKSGLNEPRFKRLKGDDTEIGLVWWCEDEEGAIKPTGNEFRCFRLRIKNFAVGRVSIFDDEDGSSLGVTKAKILKMVQRLQRFVGEIHITNPDIIPDTPRNNLEPNQNSREAIEQIRVFYSVRIAEAGGRSDFNSTMTNLKKAESLLAGTSKDPNEANDLLGALKEKAGVFSTKPRAETGKAFLKEYLQPQKRQIDRVIRALEPLASTAAKKIPSKALSKSAQKRAQSVGGPAATGAAKTMLNQMEELCSDIIDILRNQIDDVDLLAELSRKIADLFKARNLLPTEEV